MKLNNIIASVLILCALFFAIGCSTIHHKKLIGTWTVDSIIKNNKDISYFYKSNLISFENKGACYLPRINRDEAKKGRWDLKNNDTILKLTITSDSNTFNGVYTLLYWKDFDKKLQKVTIEKNNLQITCSKMLHKIN